ncbi:MAG: hypothetical protein GX254_02305 [Clostridiales bacterium]|nr:hypothetical protein [Clostridiales bacterium]
MQKPNELMLRRNGLHYGHAKRAFVLAVHFNVPLVNALSVNAKSAVLADTALRWYEENRPLDAFCCANRMCGLKFSKKDWNV